MKFTKMHGCGNDYVYVNCFEETVDDRPALARLVSDRHFGVGGDGLICICPSDKADFAMDMYNADGSCAQMCGNGIRCVAKYVYERGMTDKTVIDVETGAGVKTLWLNVENGVVESVRVCMGQPEFKAEKIPVLTDGESFINQPMEVGGMQWNVTAVSVGNPHAVVFVDNVDWLDLPTIGPLFENCPLFPETEGIVNKANIARMKDGVILLNNSRGPLVVEQDLSDALNSGKVYAAGLDVVSTEPIRPDNPLLKAKNCFITPHISWAPRESRQRLMDIAVENLRAFLAGAPVNVVNP